MRVFVTGATGFIGSAVVRELIDGGHQVVGLARSQRSAAALERAGADVRRGSLDDHDALSTAAADSDGVVHTAFIHDFADFAAAARTDTAAVQAIGRALLGSDRPLIIASGLLGSFPPGGTGTEATPASGPRAESETALTALADRGVRTAVLRLPPTVHGPGDPGFLPQIVSAARTAGTSAYIGDGGNRWPAVHRLDAAHLFCLALEAATAGSVLHGVAEEGVPFRDIAEKVGSGLGLGTSSVTADEATQHFGFLGSLVGLDLVAVSADTRASLGWEQTRPGLLADLDADFYFAEPPADD